jgi:RNA polymerase sigma-70 factor (ECF subfamily)
VEVGEPDFDGADLVLRAKARSGEAYLALVSRYKGIVASAVYTLIPDAREVEEVCEDAFAEAWRKLDELRAAEAFGAWVRKIARRLALRRIRARARTRPLGGAGGVIVDPLSGEEAPPLRGRAAGSRDVDELPAGPGSDPSERLVIRDLYERIALEISRLPSYYRDAVGLRYFHALTCKEIAATLRLPIGTVTMRLSRGSRLLRSRLSVALKDYLET